MKKIYFILPAALTVTVIIVLSGYRSMNRSHEAYQYKIKVASQNLKGIPKVPTKEELIAFRNVADKKFRDTEMMIFNLKIKTENQQSSVYDTYMKKTACLEEQLRFEKSRLQSFEKNPVNWDSFKAGFHKEMDELGTTAKNLYENFGKDVDNASNHIQSDTYIAKLNEKN
jgi:hypothetical protein